MNNVHSEWAFEQWVNQTNLHPLGLAITALCAISILGLRRSFALTPLVAMACIVAPAQRVVLGGLDFTPMRLLVICAVVRVLLRQEWVQVRWHLLDGALVVHSIARTLIFTLQYGSVSAFITQAGIALDAIGVYFAARCCLRSFSDIRALVAAFAIMAVPTAAAFVLESGTGRNVFAFFGGVPEITLVRGGRLRCQGAFAHPIVAGCFWACAVPLLAAFGLLERGLRRWLFIGGLLCSCIIIICCSSSTPVVGVLAACIGAALFSFRHWMGWVLSALVVTSVLLHFIMEAPVWHLISRITIAKGNTGYHRYMLIDSAISRFDEWWLLGTRSTAHWFWSATDVTNQFIAEAIVGGAITLAAFSIMVALAFRSVGLAWRQAGESRPHVVICWAIGICLFVHTSNFVGLTYFGQVVLVWNLQLALAGFLREFAMSRSAPAVHSRVRRRSAGRGERVRQPGAGVI